MVTEEEDRKNNNTLLFVAIPIMSWSIDNAERHITVKTSKDKSKKDKCVSKTDTNPPFAFQIAFPRGTDFAGFLQEGSKSRDLQSKISVRIESRIESADSRLQLQC